ncbi:MAG: filamentous hemagglutinin family protein [Thiobacillus sp.]
MNRNRYRLVFNTTLGMRVPVAETARSQGKSAAGKVVGGSALALAGLLLTAPIWAEGPIGCSVTNTCGPSGIQALSAAGNVNLHTNIDKTRTFIDQVGNKAIADLRSMNVSAGHTVQFGQVDKLDGGSYVPGANFNFLGRIWDSNPSVIAGSLVSAPGQNANVILVNPNGIAFMGGSQVNLNQFTASTLNIADAYVGNLTNSITTPQFEKALDGTEARGFIKVMPNARISATDSGRVMLIAPTVINQGTVEATDGQVIVAAASRVYLTASSNNSLRGLLIEVESPAGLSAFDTANTKVKDGLLDGKTVSLADAATDKLGHATNLGELSAKRGNVTMVGYAVNQRGVARATTSVVANGSIYLMAKDTFDLPGSSTSSARTGQLTLGAGSVTDITLDTQDSTTTQDTVAQGVANARLDQPSRVTLIGQDIRIEGERTEAGGQTTAGARIRAQSGVVDVYAIEANTGSTVRNLTLENGLFKADTAASSKARLHLGKGAHIDVSGLEGVQVSVERNTQEVELRGDELKDSPINRNGAIRNEKVYVDVERALANSDSGKSTLIARDRLESLKSEQKRTVAERATQGGTIGLYSQGEAIVEAGVTLDVSGGSLAYTPGSVKTTLLTSNGKPVDLSDANAETYYDGIATRYVIDYGRWNRKEVIDLGQSYRYDPGYVEGKDAGAVSVFGMAGTVLGGSDTVVGRTVTGERQREAGIAPRGARLTVGYDDASDSDINKSPAGYQDFKLNQNVVVATNGTALPEGFAFGEALTQELKNTLTLHPALMGEGRVAELAVYSNQAADVRHALSAPVSGKVAITAADVRVGANIEAAEIDIAARYTKGVPLPATPRVEIADGVALKANGRWVNDLPNRDTGASTAQIDGGGIRVAAETIAVGVNDYQTQGKVVIGDGVKLEADGGGWQQTDGSLVGGDGGTIAVQGYFVEGWNTVDAHAYGMDKGGSLSLSANRVQIGGTPLAASDAINLDTDFFTRGGFAAYTIGSFTSLDVADSAQIRTSLVNRELTSADRLRNSGTPVGALGSLVVRDARIRQSVDVTLTSSLAKAETGRLRIGKDARVESGSGATVTLNAYDLLDIQGTVATAGGTIEAIADDGIGTVWLGESAELDVAGQAETYTDNRGLVKGKVLAGGQINLEGSTVVAKTGSQIDVSGATPVRLDVANENGGLGREIGSDAGSLTVFVNDQVFLEGDIDARGGSANNRGGTLDVTLGVFEEPLSGGSLTKGVLRVAESVSEQIGGLAPGSALNGIEAKLATDRLEAAGFDRIRLSSRDAIRLEDGLSFGAGRALREIRLDAASIQTSGGDASVVAESVQMGNYDTARRAASTASTSTGTLSVKAKQMELAGKLKLEGMARAELTGTEEIRLAGLSDANARPVGELKTAADLAFHGAVAAPTSYSRYTIEAIGKKVAFTQPAGTATQPWSALGSLTVIAKDIEQAGTIWAPFGTIDLQASDSLEFKNGSLTSVAATEGSLIPFGKIENGRDWVFDTDELATNNLDIADIGDKAILAKGAKIDMQPGAKINLSGGGDLQAYEFTVGPGGSKDILADKNTYAILPGYTGGFAPVDAQEGFDRAPGEAVYLSGVPGLKDRIYTLLPAHYALLPDAYAVKLDSGLGSVLPGQAYSRQDGVRIAAGYVTDSRANAPRDANWQGVQVMTREQVRARSEFTLTRASQFFADSRNRPQDAGLLSVSTSGSGVNALKLDATYNLAAAAGGRGAQVDISALKLAVTTGTPAGIDSDAVVLDAARLNALGADSLLIGGSRSRSRSGDTTTLAVGAASVTLANDAATALKGSEVMLAASDTLTLKARSAIDAQGASGDAGHYETTGSGAFVRAASTSATFARTGSPSNSKGTLIGEAGSRIAAADSITLDATRTNDFKGSTVFTRNGAIVAGNFAVGATRISFGAAPAGSEGLTYSQAELDTLDLAGLSLISYSTFDLYGDVKVGKLDGNGKPLLQNLTLQGAGLAGIDNASKTAQLNAKNLTLTNPNNAATFTAGGALGSGNLAVTADTLTLGQGTKAIQGFGGGVTVTANELVAAAGTGKLDVNAPLTLNVARISGARSADQSLNSTAALTVAQHTADRVLAPVTALGAKWAMRGSAVGFDSRAELPSGHFKLAATNGDVKLGANAGVDVAGRAVKFFDVEKPSWGGTAEFVSDTDNVEFGQGSVVDVSAAPGGDAGTLIVKAVNGTLIADGSVRGLAPEDSNQARGEGARALIDVGSLTGFSDLNTVLNSGGFDGVRDLRVRTGNVSIASTDSVRAQTLRIAADGGTLDVAGTLDASGTDAGRIELWAKGDVNVTSKAKLAATSSGANEDGGDVLIGTRDGEINLAASDPDKGIYVSGGAGGQGGTVLLRALRTDSQPNDGIDRDDDVKVKLASTSRINGARSVSVEAVKVYEGISTLNATGTSSGTTLTLETITKNDAAFASHKDDSNNDVDHFAAIRNRLGRSDLHILSGVEVRSPGDLTLAADWNLKDLRNNGEAGVLTLRAAGDLKLNANLSDGFSHATPCTTATCSATSPAPASLLADKNSWSYRLVAGADSLATDPMSTARAAAGQGDVELAAGKLVRTGTGDIRVAAGGNIEFKDGKSVIYTAGRAADPVAGFTTPAIPLRASFTQDGGEVALRARGDIVGTASPQLFSQWLYRQGAINSATGQYDKQPAWWVRFDQFQQGVGALGGGNVTLAAGGKIENLSASSPTQTRTAGDSPATAVSHTTGGGTVRVEAGSDVLGGAYYAGRGEMLVRAGGRFGAASGGAKPVIALGAARADVRAFGDVEVGNAVTPQMLPQAAGNLVTLGVTLPPARSLYTTYGDASAIALSSLSGNTSIHQDQGRFDSINPVWKDSILKQYLLPSSLAMTSFQGDIEVGQAGKANSSFLTMMPSATGTIDLLASGAIRFNNSLTLSDMDPALVPSADKPSVVFSKLDALGTSSGIPNLIVNPLNPAGTPNAHATTPLHAGDDIPVRVYAVEGDVSGINDVNPAVLNLPKRLALEAGGNVRDLTLHIQHLDSADVSRVEAGKSLRFSSTSDRRDNAQIRIGGPGRLEITAGEDIDLGTSGGIVSRGKLDNAALPKGGADLRLIAGAGAAGVDYQGTTDRLIKKLESNPADDTSLWLARWLTGDDSLTPANALTAVQVIDGMDEETQKARVVNMLYTALKITGRDSLTQSSAYAADYTRGYAALETVFPGIEEKNADGSFKHYKGNIDLFASRIKTEQGGSIEFMAPGGDVIVGLANTPKELVERGLLGARPDVLGIVVADKGDVQGFVRNDVLVNQSRILTVGGGDVLLWSSEGDIDAGKGKKSASTVPPPVIEFDPVTGLATLRLQGAVSGSGIGALEPAGGPACGTTRCVVDLIAPKGTVNAGDAGIRAGNLNIAAAVVLGADNISVSGNSSGTPVADTSAVSAASSGASNAGGDVSSTTAALAQNLSEAARLAENLKNAFKPTFISAEVIGHGE